MHLPLFEAPGVEVKRSTALCLRWTDCLGDARGRVEYGAPVARGTCVNRELRCLTCQRTGVLSENTEPQTETLT